MVNSRSVGPRLVCKWRVVLVLSSIVLLSWCTSHIGNAPVIGTAQAAKATLSMVIPATWEDYTCFVEHLTENIASTAEQPDEVIFVVSGWQDDIWERERAAKFLHTKLTQDVHLLVVNKEQNQACNRNIGAKHATGDMIFFFDMDDVLHTRSFGVIRKAYRNYADAAGFLFSHATLAQSEKSADLGNFYPFCKSLHTPCSKSHLYVSEEMFDRLFAVWGRRSSYTHWCCRSGTTNSLAPGWLVVHRSTFLTRGMYDEDLNIGEDGELISRLLSQRFQVPFIDVPIGYYNQDHTKPACDDLTISVGSLQTPV